MLNTAQLLGIKDAIAEYRNWYDTCSKTGWSNYIFRASAASDMLNHALKTIDEEIVKLSNSPEVG